MVRPLCLCLALTVLAPAAGCVATTGDVDEVSTRVSALSQAFADHQKSANAALEETRRDLAALSARMLELQRAAQGPAALSTEDLGRLAKIDTRLDRVDADILGLRRQQIAAARAAESSAGGAPAAPLTPPPALTGSAAAPPASAGAAAPPATAPAPPVPAGPVAPSAGAAPPVPAGAPAPAVDGAAPPLPAGPGGPVGASPAASAPEAAAPGAPPASGEGLLSDEEIKRMDAELAALRERMKQGPGAGAPAAAGPPATGAVTASPPGVAPPAGVAATPTPTAPRSAPTAEQMDRLAATASGGGAGAPAGGPAAGDGSAPQPGAPASAAPGAEKARLEAALQERADGDAKSLNEEHGVKAGKIAVLYKLVKMPAAGATEVAGTAQFTLERPIAAPRADNNVSVEVKGLRVEYRWVDGRWLAGRVFDARTQAPLALGAFKAFGR